MGQCKVWKYRISYNHWTKSFIDLPIGAKVLHADMQDGEVTLWVLVNPHNKTETRTFIVVGTGTSIPHHHNELSHISTFKDGDYVWHVFETYIPIENKP